MMKCLRERSWLDPNNIKLNITQKVVPLLKAINQEIPWQLLAIVIICLTSAILVTAQIPIIFTTAPLVDFLVRRILIGFLVAGLTFGACGILYMFIDDQLIPFFKRICENYQKESLEVKKKILEDVIDKEVLK